MKSPFTYAHASGAFLKALLGHRDPVTSREAAGLTRLQGWDRLPESAVLREVLNPTARNTAACLLYCYKGPHSGECFRLYKPRTTVGKNATDGVVLTPAAGCSNGSYEFALTDRVELIGVAPHPFELNGNAEYRATLVDYDELVIFGNYFVFLDISGGHS